MVSAMNIAVAIKAYPVGATKMQVWTISLNEILRKVLEQALDLGREYRDQIEAAARGGIDLLAAMDLPFIPDSIEGVIDEATKTLGYAAVKSILDAVLAG
jgi:hypothetical protein